MKSQGLGRGGVVLTTSFVVAIVVLMVVVRSAVEIVAATAGVVGAVMPVLVFLWNWEGDPLGPAPDEPDVSSVAVEATCVGKA